MGAISDWTSFYSIVTAQRSVSFMYSGENRGKKSKVLRWRMELDEFDFDIV